MFAIQQPRRTCDRWASAGTDDQTGAGQVTAIAKRRHGKRTTTPRTEETVVRDKPPTPTSLRFVPGLPRARGKIFPVGRVEPDAVFGHFEALFCLSEAWNVVLAA